MSEIERNEVEVVLEQVERRQRRHVLQYVHLPASARQSVSNADKQ